MPHALFLGRGSAAAQEIGAASAGATAPTAPPPGPANGSGVAPTVTLPAPAATARPRPEGGTARALARSSSNVTTAPQTRPPGSDLSGLERLDAAVVPKLQAGAREAARVTGAPLRHLARVEDATVGGLVGWWMHHRRAIVLFATVVAVLGSAVHFQRYPEIQQAQADQRAADAEQTVSEPGVPAGSPGALAGGAQATGPQIGVDAAAYVEQRHEALADITAAGRRVAVVSFDEYVNPAQASEWLPQGATVHAAQLRIPAEGEEPFQTEVVGSDLAVSVQRALEAPMAAYAEEEAEVEGLLPTVTDPAWRADYERRLEELRAIRNLVRSGAGTIFAVVIEADVAALQTLPAIDGIRLVDVAPGETEVATSGFFGLLPEDRTTVTYGVPS